MVIVLAVGLFVASVSSWFWLATSPSAPRCFRWRPRFTPHVGLFDVAIMVLLIGLVDTMVVWFAGTQADGGDRTSDAARMAEHQALHASAMLVAVGCFAMIHSLRTGMRRVSIDRRLRDLLSDLRLGLFGFVLFVPPALVMQAIMTQWVPYEHPTTQLLLKSGATRDWLLAAWGAVLVAPLVEEFIFRGLLLPWLVAVARPRAWEDWRILFVGTDGSPYWRRDPAPNAFWRWLPVVLSATLFSAMHIRSGPEGAVWGPDLVPLLWLGIGWAWLARQTGRITPSWVGHFLLNSLTLLSLYVQQSAPT